MTSFLMENFNAIIVQSLISCAQPWTTALLAEVVFQMDSASAVYTQTREEIVPQLQLTSMASPISLAPQMEQTGAFSQ